MKLPRGERTVDRWFNIEAFAPALEERRGNTGPGILEAPGLFLADLSLRKQFGLTERVKLRFQADSFNTLNWANFRGLNTNVSNRDFGRISSAGRAGPGRNPQLAVKLNW